MVVRDQNRLVEVEFIAGERSFRARLRRAQIVHEAFLAALPAELSLGHRLTFRTQGGDEVFADTNLAELEDRFGTTVLHVTSRPVPAKSGEWRNLGFDHLAITIRHRSDARDFFRDVLKMQVMCDDDHLTVMAAGHTALFLFDPGQEAPLSTGQSSSWHHLGFVVDDLEAAYAHLREHRDRLLCDFTLLERDERWSLYFFYPNGDVTFLIQFSEIKEQHRGIVAPDRERFAEFLYDYASRPYRLQ
jgi:hypothetical protein